MMAPVYSDLTVPLRPDRSITQFMLENVCHTDPRKVICEDTLTDKQTTYGGLRKESFRVAHSLRFKYGLEANDTVSIISRSCVSETGNPPFFIHGRAPKDGEFGIC
jgi:acyl-CoA synthetase (AMP-forming)/AMP-acid ligase II